MVELGWAPFKGPGGLARWHSLVVCLGLGELGCSASHSSVFDSASGYESQPPPKKKEIDSCYCIFVMFNFGWYIVMVFNNFL